MIKVSNDFKQAMKQPVKELQAFVDGEGVSIRDEDDLISFKVSGEGGLCKTVMRKLEAKYLGEHNLLGKWVSAGFSVKLPSGAFERLNYGSFLVNELTISKDTGETSVVAYDKMINAMRPYVPLLIEYPIGLYTYAQKLCEACGLELGNTSFAVHNDWQIERELWENISGITYRDIFAQIAQATASTCVIGADDKVYFKPITATEETLTYANLFKLKLEDKYGPINSVVLSRSPQEDNVYLRDETSIQTHGLTEFRIENNEILDKDSVSTREDAITPIFDALKGVSYYPFEANTEGLGWYEIADSFNIETDTGDVFSTALFNFNITVDGSIKETLKTVAETKTQTQYQYATSIAKRIKNTEIIVNKQDGEIKSIVSDVYDENGVGPNKKYTQIKQDIENIEFSVQNSSGNNLIKNSVMFAIKPDKTPTVWEISGDGELTAEDDTQALSYGGVSGRSFTLKNKTVWQKVSVKVGTETEKMLYTFSTKIKKSAGDTCYIKIYNNSEEYYVDIPAGECFYVDCERKALEPKEPYYIVEFYGSADSGATFTDNMLAVGSYKSQWTQANGEVMNTNVVVDINGITVKNVDEDGQTTGDYTSITTKEFAGYSGGKKVFTLNKDVTEVEKLKARSEVTMAPIKVVPITTGDLQGWAFVPST